MPERDERPDSSPNATPETLLTGELLRRARTAIAWRSTRHGPLPSTAAAMGQRSAPGPCPIAPRHRGPGAGNR